MNYRHSYHAGNFADVVKHTVLTLVIEHLKLKPAPFRVIDTHAGTGLYDLTGEEAQKTGEWRSGISRVFEKPPPAPVAQVLKPYLDAVQNLNPVGGLGSYPGSPLLARRLIRAGDTLIACEKHPEDFESLRRNFVADLQVKPLELDGWHAWKSLLPPKERRGVVLVDPPFEEPGEFDRLVQGLGEMNRRFATGTALLWYPIKDPRASRNFHAQIKKLDVTKLMVLELFIRAPSNPDLLNGSGLAILNAPYTLEGQLDIAMPYLTAVLAQGDGAFFCIDHLKGEPLNSS